MKTLKKFERALAKEVVGSVLKPASTRMDDKCGRSKSKTAVLLLAVAAFATAVANYV